MCNFLGSVMVWGSMASKGVGCLTEVTGIMKKEDYKEILENNHYAVGKKVETWKRIHISTG